MRTAQATKEPSVQSTSTMSAEDEDECEIKTVLCTFLDRIKSGSSFATCGVYSEAPLPDMHLRGFGAIPLPLVERDADAICHPRMQDDGSFPRIERSVDRESGKDLRHQWEMKSDQVYFRNPAWDGYVQQVASKATSELGIEPNAGAVCAKLDKACLWAVGACLPPCKYVPSEVGCFGKLLICLPGAHQGGNVLLSYDREAKVSIETSCPWEYSYIAWYADVNLEFKPLESGHSLMLEYDLILPSSTKVPSLPPLLKQKGELRDLLATWNNGVEKDKATQNSTFRTLLIHLCDSHYWSRSLSLNVLKGNDRRRAEYLEELCSGIDMGLYIADLERIHCGYCVSSHPSYYGEDEHHNIDVEDEEDTTLTTIVDLDGNEVASDVSLVLEEHVAQSEPLDDSCPDNEDFDDDYAGVTHYYWKTVLVMIPSIAKVDWLPQERKQSRPNKRKRGVEIIDLE